MEAERPHPQPLPVPPRPGAPRWLVWGAVVAALLVTTAVVLAVVAAPRALERFVAQAEAGGGFFSEDGESDPSVLFDDARLEWTADGQFAIAQLADDDGTPKVLVWSRESGKTMEARAAILAEVEQVKPRLWLAPSTASAVVVETETIPPEERDPDMPEDVTEEGYSSGLPGALETIETGKRPLVWDLARNAAPLEAGPAQSWWPWPAPKGAAAVVLDPSDQNAPHAEPRIATFSEEESRGNRRSAGVPGANVFRPVGWSPSGKYFAAVGLRRYLDPEDSAYPGESHLVIFSASDGRIVADADLTGSGDDDGDDSYGETQSRIAVWDDRDDRLYFVKRHSSMKTNSDYGVLMTLAPGGKPREAVEALGWKSPGEWAHSFDGVLIGSDANGPIAAFGLESEWTTESDLYELHLYRLHASGPEYVSKVSIEGRPLRAAVSRNGDLLVMTEAQDENTDYALEVYRGYTDVAESVWTHRIPY